MFFTHATGFGRSTGQELTPIFQYCLQLLSVFPGQTFTCYKVRQRPYKYRHGGRWAGKQFKGEERLLVTSPKVATYDSQPEMSAPEVASRCAEALRQERFDFTCLNFANPDMVGHTGVFEAAVKAVEAVDEAARMVVEAARDANYSISIIADHGNADCMRNEDGSPHMAHTTALVPHLIIKDGFSGPIRPGKLADVASTILKLTGLPIPETMTGSVLVDT